MAQEAMDVCLQVLMANNKSMVDRDSVRNSVLIISHITFRDCRVHFFPDNLSRIMMQSARNSRISYRSEVSLMRGKSMVQDEYAALFQKASLLGTAKVLENDPKIRYLSFEDHYIFIHLLKKKVSEKND